MMEDPKRSKVCSRNPQTSKGEDLPTTSHINQNSSTTAPAKPQTDSKCKKLFKRLLMAI